MCSKYLAPLQTRIRVCSISAHIFWVSGGLGVPILEENIFYKSFSNSHVFTPKDDPCTLLQLQYLHTLRVLATALCGHRDVWEAVLTNSHQR